MLSELQIRGFRCFERARVELGPGATCIVGPNARGKTSLLEAACVLLRLQSPRTSALKEAVRFGEAGFALDAIWNGHHCQYYYSVRRRKLLLDDVEQRRANEYLGLARVVWFGNDDLDLIRGGSEGRRRFMDFAIVQMHPTHRTWLRNYEKALRSRNALLKSGGSRREISAYDGPLIQSGEAIRRMRQTFVNQCTPSVRAMNEQIGGDGPELQVSYRDGTGEDFGSALTASQPEEVRLRQTMIGPHRDDLELKFDGKAASSYASEGQQRTAALALRLGQSIVLGKDQSHTPLFLIDDIFGELDPVRRNRLLGLLPTDGQQIITTTHLDWLTHFSPQVLNIEAFR